MNKLMIYWYVMAQMHGKKSRKQSSRLNKVWHLDFTYRISYKLK